MEFKTIKENVQTEIVEKKSKFISNFFYVENINDAEDKIKEVKKKYHDAKHNCIAYRVLEDEKIVEVAKKENIKFYKGSLENVLERYYNAALENSLDVVVRITSDCPCADANIIDEIILQKKKQLETIQQHKKSLIYEYVTGKKEVPVNE